MTVIFHEAEEGGFSAEAPALPGCASQGETEDEVLANMLEAVEGSQAIDPPIAAERFADRIMGKAVGDVAAFGDAQIEVLAIA